MELFAILAAIAAVISAIVAITSNGHAARSADAAVRSSEAAKLSVDEAKRSADAAQDSLQLARSERDRATERSDVEWKLPPGKRTSGLIVIQNIGQDTAHGVELTIYVKGARHNAELGDVPGGESISYDLQTEYDAVTAEERESARSMVAAGYVFASRGSGLLFTARISWISRHGTPGVQVIGRPHKE